MHIAKHIEEFHALGQQIAPLLERQKALREQILAHAATAEHETSKSGTEQFRAESESAELLISYPAQSVKFPVKEEEKLKALLGDHFKKLFEPVKSYAPIKAFREVAAALLPKPAVKKLLEIVESPNAPKLSIKAKE